MKIIRIWTKHKWSYSLISRVYHLITYQYHFCPADIFNLQWNESSCKNNSMTVTINTSWTFPSRYVVFSWNTVSTLCTLWTGTSNVAQLWPGTSNKAAWLKLDSCLCFVFRGSYRKKIEFWYDQCSHGQTAFCSYILGQIALYLQKVICGKKIRLHWYMYGCFSGIRSGSSTIFDHKRVHAMHFLFVFKN